MMLSVDVQGKSAEDAAKAWLDGHKERWELWLSKASS
jgi:ABC-type proline/glycine betaine transport system substrate-binding protein